MDDSDAADDGAAPPVDLSTVSFGALAHAQATLAPAGRRAARAAAASDATASARSAARAARAGAPGAKPQPAPAPRRSSKHAPREQSSKKPVPRLREVLADERRKPRDPRFDPLITGGEGGGGGAYAFLDEYRDREMAELRAQLRKTRDAAARDRLGRQLASMESRREAARRRLDKEALLRDHRRREKELVARGKKPFYLKKSEQRERLLTKRYEAMTDGQVDRAMARKRKKVAGKEKKELGSLERAGRRR